MRKKKILTLGATGTPQLLSAGGKREDLPIKSRASALLVLDSSASMQGDKLEDAKRGVIEFAGHAHKNGYRVGLVQFNSTARLLCELTSDLAQVRRALEAMTAGGSTNMSAAIMLGIDSLPSEGTRAMTVFTDGEPDSEKDALLSANNAKQLGIDIITIGTRDANRAFLERISSRSNLSIQVENNEVRSGLASAAKLLPPAK